SGRLACGGGEVNCFSEAPSIREGARPGVPGARPEALVGSVRSYGRGRLRWTTTSRWAKAPACAGTGRATTGTDRSGMLSIGVDIGGTKIAAGVVDGDGEIIAATTRSTPATDAALIEADRKSTRLNSSHVSI